MTQPLKIAVLGFWHVHAGDYAREVREHPGTELVAAWDHDRERGEQGALELGVEFVAGLEELLARDELDAVTVTTETSRHGEVIRAAIRAGKHVFTEKLLAPTVAECEQLVDAARAAGVALVVSLPRLAEATTVTARRLLDEGRLGELSYLRVRMAHDGWLRGWLPERFADPEAAVGGALADLGCHPVYLVQHFLGARPERVAAQYTRMTGRAVEDNAVVTMSYPGGAIGVAEASFVTTPGAFAFEARGTEATLLFGFGREELIAKGGDFGDSWAPVPLDAAQPSPFDRWVDAMRLGTSTEDNQRAAIELTRLVVAANAAARPTPPHEETP